MGRSAGRERRTPADVPDPPSSHRLTRQAAQNDASRDLETHLYRIGRVPGLISSVALRPPQSRPDTAPRFADGVSTGPAH